MADLRIGDAGPRFFEGARGGDARRDAVADVMGVSATASPVQQPIHASWPSLPDPLAAANHVLQVLSTHYTQVEASGRKSYIAGGPVTSPGIELEQAW
jgi:hypothetical protein